MFSSRLTCSSRDSFTDSFHLIKFIIMGFAYLLPQSNLYSSKNDSSKTWRSTPLGLLGAEHLRPRVGGPAGHPSSSLRPQPLAAPGELGAQPGLCWNVAVPEEGGSRVHGRERERGQWDTSDPGPRLSRKGGGNYLAGLWMEADSRQSHQGTTAQIPMCLLICSILQGQWGNVSIYGGNCSEVRMQDSPQAMSSGFDLGLQDVRAGKDSGNQLNPEVFYLWFCRRDLGAVGPSPPSQLDQVHFEPLLYSGTASGSEFGPRNQRGQDGGAAARTRPESTPPGLCDTEWPAAGPTGASVFFSVKWASQHVLILVVRSKWW